MSDAIRGARRESKTVSGDIAMDDFLQSGFIDWDDSLLEAFNFFSIVVDANDVVPNVRETSTRYESDIPRANDSDIHTQPIKSEPL